MRLRKKKSFFLQASENKSIKDNGVKGFIMNEARNWLQDQMYEKNSDFRWMCQRASLPWRHGNEANIYFIETYRHVCKMTRHRPMSLGKNLTGHNFSKGR